MQGRRWVQLGDDRRVSFNGTAAAATPEPDTLAMFLFAARGTCCSAALTRIAWLDQPRS